MPSLPGWRTACAAALALASCVVVARAQALELAGSFRMSGGVCHTLRVSPDGDLLASGGDAGEVLLYELPSGDLSRRLVAGDDQIGAVCFSSDGGRLAAAGEKLVVFDLADGAELHRSDCGNPVALDWSLDGARLCVVRRKGLAELLDGDTYRVIAKLPLGDIVSADAVAFDRRSQRVAVGTRRGRIRVFDAASGESVDEVVQPGWVRDLCWLDDGRLLAMGWDGVLRGLGDDRRLGRFGLSVDATPDGRIVLARSGQDLLRIDGGAGPRSLGFGGPIALHPDGRRWLRAIGDRIELRAFAGDAAPRTFRNRHSRQSKAAVLTGDGRFAALAPSFQRGDLELFEVRTGRRLEVGGLPDDVTLLANHAGIELATMRALGRDGGVERRELQLWKVSGGERPRVDLVRTVPFAIEARGSRSLRDWPVLSRDLRYLSWGDQLVDLVDPARSTSLDDRWVIAIAPLRDELEGTRVVLSGRRLALASEVAVDAGGEQVAKLDLARPGDGMAVAPGGKRLALALADAVEVRSLPGLELLRRLPGQARIPAWVDDRHLLAVDGEHRLVLFAVRDERLLAALPLGSHVRQLDVRPALGVALVTLVDRSVLVRVRPR